MKWNGIHNNSVHTVTRYQPQAARKISASALLYKQAKSDNALNRLPRIKTKAR